MRYTKLVHPQPFEDVAKGITKAAKSTKAAVSGSNDFYGANSLEHFSSASGLTYTHEDAQGFLDYPTSFPGKAANFWFRDGGVKVWEYEEAYDNWQDTYGMDSVMVFYHSGHGNMDSNGVFQAPLGGKWDNRDWAFSNQMAFANEELRYLFWSTCFSLRVSGPDNPVRTWWNPNKGGLRMLFGYETTSVDDPNYGKFLWEEWRKGKTFARAFLDASWRISHDQVPVAMAVGSNQTDAVNRLNNERFFSRTPVAKGWYQWQWIGTLPTRRFAKKTTVPRGLRALVLDQRQFDDDRLSKIAQKIGFTKRETETLHFDERGNRMMISSKITANVNQEGALNISLGNANLENTRLLDEKKAIKIAQELIDDLGFSKNTELTLGNIRHRFSCGGTMKGSGMVEKPSAVETIVQFRQCHKGVESVNSDHGLIAVCVDNDGKVVNIYNSTRTVLEETDKPRSVITPPPDKRKTSKENSLMQFKRNIQGIVNRNANPLLKIANKTHVIREKVGYDFSGNLGVIVHQKDVEISSGGFRKRHKIRVPVLG